MDCWVKLASKYRSLLLKNLRSFQVWNILERKSFFDRTQFLNVSDWVNEGWRENSVHYGAVIWASSQRQELLFEILKELFSLIISVRLSSEVHEHMSVLRDVLCDVWRQNRLGFISANLPDSLLALLNRVSSSKKLSDLILKEIVFKQGCVPSRLIFKEVLDYPNFIAFHRCVVEPNQILPD